MPGPSKVHTPRYVRCAQCNSKLAVFQYESISFDNGQCRYCRWWPPEMKEEKAKNALDKKDPTPLT